jgi:hypothetical protein
MTCAGVETSFHSASNFMADHERAMLAYVQLAEISKLRQQPLGVDKFLVLAGAAACRAGWLEVAERCHKLLAADNPRHLLARYPGFPQALRDAGFQSYLRRLERFVGYERAELLLADLGILVKPAETGAAGPLCLELLSGSLWGSPGSET